MHTTISAGGAPPIGLYLTKNKPHQHSSMSRIATRPACRILASDFPPFLPREVNNIKDPFAKKLAARIERLPVENGDTLFRCLKELASRPGHLTFWDGASQRLPSCNVASKRHHLYQFWNTYIKRPVTLVGPSLGAAVAIDFVVNHPECVEKLVLIDASVYSEGTGNLASLPKTVAYAGVSLLKSVPLRLYATSLAFKELPFDTRLDWANIGRLHCLLPWWADATVDFMTSGGYNVVPQIGLVKQKTLVIWGENDQIIDNKLAVRLHCELPDAILRQIPDCGHIPHVEKPAAVSKLIKEFLQA